MSKAEAISHFKNQADLASALKISEAAVSQWDESEIPELREFQINRILSERTE